VGPVAPNVGLATPVRATRVKRTVGLVKAVHHVSIPVSRKFIRVIRNALTAARTKFHENVFTDCNLKGRHAQRACPQNHLFFKDPGLVSQNVPLICIKPDTHQCNTGFCLLTFIWFFVILPNEKKKCY
jgi:hypothetical protein